MALNKHFGPNNRFDSVWSRLKKRMDAGEPVSKLDGELHQLGAWGLMCPAHGLPYALSAYRALGDREAVSMVGDICLERNLHYTASKAFRFLGEPDRMFEAMLREGLKRPHEIVLVDFLRCNGIPALRDPIMAWAAKRGTPTTYDINPGCTINMGFSLVDDYDVGVGVARGGLTSAYVFDMLGLPIKIAQCHKRDGGVDLWWVDDVVSTDFAQKRVAVLDKDVVSGATAKTVLDEVRTYNPQSVDLVLNHNFLPDCTYSLDNAPPGYDRVVYPEQFGYSNFDKAVAAFKIEFDRRNEL